MRVKNKKEFYLFYSLEKKLQCNSREQKKNFHQIIDTKMPLEWQTWCRLCGKMEVGDTIIKIETIPNLIVLVQKHFNISVSE